MVRKMDRRDFLKTAGAFTVGIVADPDGWEREITGRLFSSEVPASATENINSDRIKEIRDFCGEYGTPYNPNVFEAGERIIFKGREPYLDIIARENVTIPELTIKLTDADASIEATKMTLHDVSGAVEIPLGNCFLWKVPPVLKYKLVYRKPDGGSEETCYRHVKTPFGSLKDGPIKIIVFSDAHLPDDRGKKEAFQDPKMWEMRNNGEYVNRLFLSRLVNNPNYQPSGDEQRLMNGFNMASAMWYIVNHENPDFVIDAGDHHGGFGHTWEDLGLPKESEATPAEKDAIIRMFRLGQRKILSALMSHIPWYQAPGNHDGRCGWVGTREYATKWMKQFLPLPGLVHGGSPDENYYPIAWGGLNNSLENRPEVLCAIMDSTGYSMNQPRKPEDWTAGEEQTRWLADTLKKDASFRLVFLHNIFGGWPTQSECTIGGEHNYAYGRGMGFTREYYEELNRFLEENGGAHLRVDPKGIEQVCHTNTFLRSGVNAVVYGHDHIFNGKKIGRCDDGRELHAVCAGSTKRVAETDWFKEPFFRKDYGDCARREFFTCPGYVVIEISAGGIDFNYKNASPVSLNWGTNIPPGTRVGGTVSTYSI